MISLNQSIYSLTKVLFTFLSEQFCPVSMNSMFLITFSEEHRMRGAEIRDGKGVCSCFAAIL